jgi:hypothetical protein
MLGITIPTSIAVMAMASGAAWAQTTYLLEGSDTLTQVIQQAIIQSGATSLIYNNVGSGQAEKNMATLSGADVLQGIGPMSRNFVPSVLTMAKFDPDGKWQDSSIQPTATNVLCLDAPVVSVGNIKGHCTDISAPLVNPADPTMAAPMSDLSIILSGYPASGTMSKATTAECSDSRRLAALNRLTACQGVSRIDHIYRRDDKSGTQDTWREHLQFNLWCNGKSEGNVNAPGSNLKNEDLDPIRRPCIGADATKAQTACTYYPLKTQCAAGAPDITDPTYGTIKCSQGLIVALSETDPGAVDITESIGKRVGLDLNGFTIGLAGLASVELPGKPSVGTTINTVTFSDANIRAQQYMLARRLFLQRNPAGTGDPGRDAAESTLYTWATNRCNIFPLCEAAGFLPPLPDCTTSGCLDTGNMTCLQAAPGVGTPKQNIGAIGEACNSSYPCVGTGAACSSGNCEDPYSVAKMASSFACNVSAAGVGDQTSAECTSGTCTIDSTLVAGVCK